MNHGPPPRWALEACILSICCSLTSTHGILPEKCAAVYPKVTLAINLRPSCLASSIRWIDWGIKMHYWIKATLLSHCNICISSYSIINVLPECLTFLFFRPTKGKRRLYLPYCSSTFSWNFSPLFVYLKCPQAFCSNTQPIISGKDTSMFSVWCMNNDLGITLVKVPFVS